MLVLLSYMKKLHASVTYNNVMHSEEYSMSMLRQSPPLLPLFFLFFLSVRWRNFLPFVFMTWQDMTTTFKLREQNWSKVPPYLDFFHTWRYFVTCYFSPLRLACHLPQKGATRHSKSTPPENKDKKKFHTGKTPHALCFCFAEYFLTENGSNLS